MKINENEQLLLGIRGGVGGVPPPSNCWQNLLRGIRGGYPPRPIAGRCCCGGPGGGTPSQSGVTGVMSLSSFMNLIVGETSRDCVRSECQITSEYYCMLERLP